ncbi:hypothetical protein P8C59_006897 [Phyllachora maydis]|uniref:Uncharacterized protein n=1 Tax=Phyllachora maydis TaxID=1825666 RepID=A0AAD9I8F6_9PEZI|nr:hypothetical protein P8C59_006897 [Phyllachora maydis]
MLVCASVFHRINLGEEGEESTNLQNQGIRGIIVNSGCANAVTGKGGLEDAEKMAREADKKCRRRMTPWARPTSIGSLQRRQSSTESRA